MENYPSIFNDVIGPVMRGPSSSHCAASLRIGRLCRDLMDGQIRHIRIEFDPAGSLATTHKSQGSDMGLFGGLLGWEAFDERLPDSQRFLEAAGIQAEIVVTDIQAGHPNTYKIILGNGEEAHTLTAISTGGGMIEVIGIDGAEVSMAGDFYETLVYCRPPVRELPPDDEQHRGNEICRGDKLPPGEGIHPEKRWHPQERLYEEERMHPEDRLHPEEELYPYVIAQYLKSSFSYDELIWHEGDVPFFEIKSQHAPEQPLLEELLSMDAVFAVKKLEPVLPVLSSKNTKIPFITCGEMLEYNRGRKLELWELAVEYESARGNIRREEVLHKMTEIVRIMRASIQTGLNGTSYEDRLLGSQSVYFREQMERKKLVEGEVLNRVIMYVSAIMEVKSSMGVIVAAPTAGSCGALPGAVVGVGESLGLSERKIVEAMLAAGLLGVFISAHATFAAEVGGCQAECGSGACMAAASIVYLAGGSLDQSLSAASMALQNSLGMICDPIANRVEAPCLGKNVMAASNALSCANMALANYNHLIPLDEVIETMAKVGHSIPHTLRCTNLGGLSITPAAKELETKLENRSFFKSC